MDWKKLGQHIADAAPLVGGVLGGPGAGAIGLLLSRTFGTSAEPEKVLEAIQRDPEAAVKIKQFEMEHELELTKLMIAAETSRIQEETKQLESVNTTMQAETKSKWWFSAFWRPFWGVVSGAAFGVVTGFICYLAYKGVVGGKVEAIAMIPQLVTAFAALFAIPGATLGVTAWHRGKMQRIEAGEVGFGMMDSFRERIGARFSKQRVGGSGKVDRPRPWPSPDEREF